MTRKLQKGTIAKMHRDRMTGTSFVEINNVDKGLTLVGCLGTPIAKAFDKAFGGGVIVDGKFHQDGIANEVIIAINLVKRNAF